MHNPYSILYTVGQQVICYHVYVTCCCVVCCQVSEIKPEWLVEIAPHYYSKKDIADEGKKMPKGKGKSAAT